MIILYITKNVVNNDTTGHLIYRKYCMFKISGTISAGLLQTSLIGGVVAGLFALISVYILMKWFKKKEINAMRPFAYYCWIVGLLMLGSRLFNII